MFLAIALQCGDSVLVGDVDLRGHHYHWLLLEMRAKAGQFAKYYFHVLRHVVPSAGVRYIDQMDEQARAFDVPQELYAKPGTVVSSLDQTGNVGDHKADFFIDLADRNHAELRLECSEGIIRNLWAGRRNPRNQSRFADIGITHKPHVSQQLQLEAVIVLLARATRLVLAWRLMH